MLCRFLYNFVISVDIVYLHCNLGQQYANLHKLKLT